MVKPAAGRAAKEVSRGDQRGGDLPRHAVPEYCQRSTWWPSVRFLKSPEGGAYTFLTDETAVDYPKREKRFDIIYHLYSFQRNDRLRLRVQVSDGETVPSVTGVWITANWLEREIYDMFGVVYEGHPDLEAHPDAG